MTASPVTHLSLYTVNLGSGDHELASALFACHTPDQDVVVCELVLAAR